MEDSSEQIRNMCKFWWDSRDLEKDQKMFREKNYSMETCWKWQLKQFLNTSFVYKNNLGETKTFIVNDLDEHIKIRLIRQLGVDIGLFLRDFEKIYLERKN